jgi:hypothetical protein
MVGFSKKSNHHPLLAVGFSVVEYRGMMWRLVVSNSRTRSTPSYTLSYQDLWSILLESSWASLVGFISVLCCRFVRLTYTIICCCRRTNLQSPRWHPPASPRHHLLPCKISPRIIFYVEKMPGQYVRFSNLHAFGMVVMTVGFT